jgi:hypothetical protein
MSHDATKVQAGTTRSSSRSVDNRSGDPLVLKAGIGLRLKSDGTLSTLATDGKMIGISLGRSLSDIKKVAILRRGLQVPVRLTASFVPAIGTQVFISDTTGLAGASGTGFTGINATYCSGALTMIEEDGTENAATAALIDMPGGV